MHVCVNGHHITCSCIHALTLAWAGSLGSALGPDRVHNIWRFSGDVYAGFLQGHVVASSALVCGKIFAAWKATVSLCICSWFGLLCCLVCTCKRLERSTHTAVPPTALPGSSRGPFQFLPHVGSGLPGLGVELCTRTLSTMLPFLAWSMYTRPVHGVQARHCT
jgi:hypothetical protein